MPILKSAIKKFRQSVKRREHNRGIKAQVKSLLDSFKKKPTPTAYSRLVSKMDKAVKTNILHKNKASRLKSRLAKLLPSAALHPSTKRVRG